MFSTFRLIEVKAKTIRLLTKSISILDKVHGLVQIFDVFSVLYSRIKNDPIVY